MSIEITTALKRLGLALAVAGIASAGAYAATNDAGSSADANSADSATSAQSGQANPGGAGGAADQQGRPQRGFRGGAGNGGYGGGPGPRGFGPQSGFRRGRASWGPMARARFGRAKHGRMGPGMRMDRGLMAALRQLNLTPVQREQVRTIEFNAAESVRMKAATERQQQSAVGQQGLDNFTVLANPGDPNYARAVQQLRTRATQRVQDSVQLAMDTEQKIYNVLTADQKAQLPKVLADTKTRMQQRINDVRARRQRGQGGPGGSPGVPPAHRAASRLARAQSPAWPSRSTSCRRPPASVGCSASNSTASASSLGALAPGPAGRSASCLSRAEDCGDSWSTRSISASTSRSSFLDAGSMRAAAASSACSRVSDC